MSQWQFVDIPGGPANNGTGGENITRDDEQSFALPDVSRGNSEPFFFTRLASLHVKSAYVGDTSFVNLNPFVPDFF